MEASKLYELGTVLKKRREALGITREELALRIKISSKNLHAIEEGLTDNLPQPIFTRSFIRSYAQVVDLEKDELDRMLAEVFPSEIMDNINPGLTTAAREQSVGINAQGGGKKAVLLILLVLLLGAGTWFYFNVFKTNAWTSDGPAATQTSSQTSAEQNGEAATPPDAAAGPAAPAQDGAETTDSSPASESTATGAAIETGGATAGTAAAGGSGERYAVGRTDSPNGAAGTANTTGANGGTAAQTRAATAQGRDAGTQRAATAQTGAATALADAGAAGSQTAAARNPAGQDTAPSVGRAATAGAGVNGQRVTPGNTVSQSNASAAQPPAPGRQRLLVSGVSGECWINVKFDDVGERNLRLLPGRHFVLDFRNQATLVLGNAAAVKVSYNGQPLNYSADPGDVRVFRFPR